MSNGALFFDPEVRRDAAKASRVKLSMHFWDEASFQATVRPHPSLHFEEVYEGWRRFREIYQGSLDIEFFALPGMNDDTEALDKVARLMTPLRPDTVTVNHAERPPAESSVAPLSADALAHLKAFFGMIATSQAATQSAPPQPFSEAALLALARRHPLTPIQFSRYFGVPESQIIAVLQKVAATDPYAARALLPHGEG
jgi:wyosine [tRNA(Phe)-imidazoG37] synthetase (radical SAM superfamily)